MDAKEEAKASRAPLELGRIRFRIGSLTLELMTLDIEHEV